jgi:hypothetical protein
MRLKLLPMIAAMVLAFVAILSAPGSRQSLFASEEQGAGCPGIAPTNRCCHCANYGEGPDCSTVEGVGSFTCEEGAGHTCPPNQNCNRKDPD